MNTPGKNVGTKLKCQNYGANLSRKVSRIKANHFDKFQSQTKESVIFTKIREKSKSNTRAKRCIPCRSLIERRNISCMFTFLPIFSTN